MLRQNNSFQIFYTLFIGCYVGAASVVALLFCIVWARCFVSECYFFRVFLPLLHYKIKKMRQIMLFFKEKTLYLRVFKRDKINHNKN